MINMKELNRKERKGRKERRKGKCKARSFLQHAVPDKY
jgi:hypothetical protein